jgi:TRAP-type C4-dicarboxylate transport system permease small subunit
MVNRLTSVIVIASAAIISNASAQSASPPPPIEWPSAFLALGGGLTTLFFATRIVDRRKPALK